MFFFSTQDRHHRRRGSEKVRSSRRGEFFDSHLRLFIRTKKAKFTAID